MISPFTPPGTKIVCIDAKGKNTWGDHPLVIEGSVYTLSEWYSPILFFIEEVPTNSMGHPLVFHARRFRKAELPRVLTDILIAVPLVLSEKAKEHAQ